jgi:hypothetical protein
LANRETVIVILSVTSAYSKYVIALPSSETPGLKRPAFGPSDDKRQTVSVTARNRSATSLKRHIVLAFY